MIDNHATLRSVKETIEAALRTSHERKSGIGPLGSVVSHNLAWDATIALNEAGLLDTMPEPHDSEEDNNA